MPQVQPKKKKGGNPPTRPFSELRILNESKFKMVDEAPRDPAGTWSRSLSPTTLPSLAQVKPQTVLMLVPAWRWHQGALPQVQKHFHLLVLLRSVLKNTSLLPTLDLYFIQCYNPWFHLILFSHKTPHNYILIINSLVFISLSLLTVHRSGT